MPTVTDEVITYTRLDVTNFVAGGKKMVAAQESILNGERKVRRETTELVRDLGSIQNATDAAGAAFNHLSRIFKVGLGPGIAVGVGVALEKAFEEVAAKAREELKELQQPLRIPIEFGDTGKVDAQIAAAKQAMQAANDKRNEEHERPKSLIERAGNSIYGLDKSLDEATAAVSAEEQGKINALVQEGVRLRETEADQLRAQIGMSEDEAALEKQRISGAKMVADARFEEKGAVQEIVDLQEQLLRQQQAIKNGEATRAARLKLAEAETPVSDTQSIDRIKLRRQQIQGDLDAGGLGVTFGHNDRDKHNLNEGAHKKLTRAEITALKAEDAQLAAQEKTETKALATRQRGLDLETAKLKVGAATEAQRQRIFELELAYGVAAVKSAETAQARQEAENKLGDIVKARIAYKEQELAKEEEIRKAFQQRAEEENEHRFSMREQTLIKGQENAGNKQTAELLQIRLGAQEKIHQENDKAKAYDREGNTEAAKKARQEADEIRRQETQDLNEYSLTHDPRRRAELRRRQQREAHDSTHYARNATAAARLATRFESDYGASRGAIVANGAAGTAIQHQKETAANTAATTAAVKEAVGVLNQLAGRPPLL